MNNIVLATAAALTLLTAPVALAAQDADAPIEAAADDSGEPADSEAGAMREAMAMLGQIFPSEPLTAEQEARLPAAEALVVKVIPEGTMGEMMDKMFAGMLGPIIGAFPNGAANVLAKQIGTSEFGFSLDEAQAAELAGLFDPAWQERQQREAAMFPTLMKEAVVLMEPGMRKAMSELYAIRFSSGELTEIDAFFSTGTGFKYAREAFLMAGDPRIMSSTLEAMPALIGMMGDLEVRMAASVADLPAARSFAELTPAERAKVAEMTGYSVEEIEANLEAAALIFDDAIEAGAAAPEDPAEYADDAAE